MIKRALLQEDVSTRVVNIYKDPFDIYIGRPGRGRHSIYGNPYAISAGQNRSTVIAWFEDDLLTSVDARFAEIRRNLHTLKGKVLGCYCAPADCHGHVLAWHAESLEPGEVLPLGGKFPRLTQPTPRMTGAKVPA